MITYAQNFEDVMLARLFASRPTGFYIDIGASHPTRLSVTRHFYDLGWCGINVEPITRNWERFVVERPRDINLNVAIGCRPGRVTFTEVPDNDALSTLDDERIAHLRASGMQLSTCEVECITGDSLFERCPVEVDFLKIDVEGAEDDVLRSIDLRRHRPKVLVIEAVAPIDRFPGWDAFAPEALGRWASWEPGVLASGYRLGHFDGLNRFYVREDLAPLAQRLSTPPGVFDFILPDFAESLESRHREDTAALHAELAARAALFRKVRTLARIRRRTIGLLRPIARIVRTIMARLTPRPRLGNLNQHPPRAHVSAFTAGPASLPAVPPRISIVTPSFRQGAFIERTLRSVLDQDYPALEYRVQDGGSGDGTADVLRRHEARLAGWVSEADDGQSDAINRGFAATSGEIMGWLNSDDLLLPGALHVVADYFARHPEVDVVYGDRVLIDEDDMEIGRWLLPGHDDGVLSWADFVPQETLFWRRTLWDRVGRRVDPSFRFAMDWDLLLRFRDAGARFAHIPRFLGAFRIHRRQKTSAAIADIGYAEMDRLRLRALGRVPTRTETRRAILPFLVRHLATDLVYRIRRALGAGNRTGGRRPTAPRRTDMRAAHPPAPSPRRDRR